MPAKRWRDICRRGRRRSALAVQTDVTDPASVQSMVDYGHQALWPAGYPGQQRRPGPEVRPSACQAELLSPGSGAFEDFPLEAWNQALAVNLTGAFLCCQAAVQPMLAQGGGVIINLSSIYGLVARTSASTSSPDSRRNIKPVYYSVTKAGIWG